MSGVHGQMLGHLVRRGVSAAQVHFSEAGPEPTDGGKTITVDFNPREYLPVMIVGIITALLIASVRLSSCHHMTRRANHSHRSATLLVK